MRTETAQKKKVRDRDVIGVATIATEGGTVIH